MRSGPEVTPAPCKSISSGVLESDREQRWGGEVSLFWLLHDGHGKCCRYHSASGSSSHHWGPLLASPDGAVWGFGAVLTMAPLSLGKKLEGQALLPVAPAQTLDVNVRCGAWTGGRGCPDCHHSLSLGVLSPQRTLPRSPPVCKVVKYSCQAIAHSNPGSAMY